ncbi:hypothetical protein GCM10017673_38450 [Streptosporangium violaceochromogenes]|nr:hypothetical protein GCM10017673_38450 [Streptosporangium violaceochromogenes]
MTGRPRPAACPSCGGTLPGDGPDETVCRCGSMWEVGEPDWRTIRHRLALRSGHACEICGILLGPGQEGTVHHRQPRGMGGTRRPTTHGLSNLMMLCGGRLGGVTGCHGLRVELDRAAAETLGWIVPHGNGPASDPRLVPIVLWHSGRRVRLDDVEAAYLPPLDNIPYHLPGPALEST